MRLPLALTENLSAPGSPRRRRSEERFAQNILLYVARRRERKVVDDDPVSRRLVGRQPVATVRIQLVGIGCPPLRRADECGDLLAPCGVGDADDRDVRDIVVVEKHLLDFARVDVLTPRIIMSFKRPPILQWPRVSIDARSPVCSHPSASIAAAVASGLSK